MSKLKSCPDCRHKVSLKAQSCPNCGRINNGSYNQAINAFIWRFFLVIFLLFVISNMVGDYRDSSRNELGERLDELGLEMEESSERMRRAIGENN